MEKTIAGKQLLPITCHNPKKKGKRVLTLHDIQSKTKNTFYSLNRVLSYDVTAAIMVPKNDKTADMLVRHANPAGDELFSQEHTFIVPINWHCWSLEWKRSVATPWLCLQSWGKFLILETLDKKGSILFTKDLNFTTPWVPKSSTRPPLSPLKKHLRRFSVITINSFHTNVFKY